MKQKVDFFNDFEWYGGTNGGGGAGHWCRSAGGRGEWGEVKTALPGVLNVI